MDRETIIVATILLWLVYRLYCLSYGTENYFNVSPKALAAFKARQDAAKAALAIDKAKQAALSDPESRDKVIKTLKKNYNDKYQLALNQVGNATLPKNEVEINPVSYREQMAFVKEMVESGVTIVPGNLKVNGKIISSNGVHIDSNKALAHGLYHDPIEEISNKKILKFNKKLTATKIITHAKSNNDVNIDAVTFNCPVEFNVDGSSQGDKEDTNMYEQVVLNEKTKFANVHLNGLLYLNGGTGCHSEQALKSEIDYHGGSSSSIAIGGRSGSNTELAFYWYYVDPSDRKIRRINLEAFERLMTSPGCIK